MLLFRLHVQEIFLEHSSRSFCAMVGSGGPKCPCGRWLTSLRSAEVATAWKDRMGKHGLFLHAGTSAQCPVDSSIALSVFVKDTNEGKKKTNSDNHTHKPREKVTNRTTSILCPPHPSGMKVTNGRSISKAARAAHISPKEARRAPMRCNQTQCVSQHGPDMGQHSSQFISRPGAVSRNTTFGTTNLPP